MDYKVSRVHGLKGAVSAPPSKSYTHRAFIVASLAEGESWIENYLRSGDTLSTVKALRSFGIEIDLSETARVNGTGGRLKTPSRPMDCENSGTTIRLISGVAALNGKVTLTGDASLQKRPMQPLLDALDQLGVRAHSLKGNGTPPVVIEGGGLRGGRAALMGDVSSQFISSLLIVAPYAREEVEIVLTTPLKSKPYVDITLDVMESYGIRVINEGYESFRVPVGRRYKGREYLIEGDYTNASYFLSLAALTGSDITVHGLIKDSKQGDTVILKILDEMGADAKVAKGEVTVKGRELRGIEVDLGNSPDLLPTVAALACRAKGTTVIKNVGHARHKESDRLATCTIEFRKLGAEITEKRDGLVIKGKEGLRGTEVESHGDHRLAMALSILGMAADGTTTVKKAECASISYPGFFKALESLF